MSILMHTREAPKEMDTQALFVEAGNLASIIQSQMDLSTQPDIIDRFAEVLAELSMQRSFINERGTTLTANQKSTLEPWYILLSEATGYGSQNKKDERITQQATEVATSIQQVMHTPPKTVTAPPPKRPQLPPKKAPITIPKKKEALLPKIHPPSDINTPFAELFGQHKKVAPEPLPSAHDTVTIAEEVFVPPVYTPEELLQRCEDCVVHFYEENRTVILNKAKLLTHVMDILLQEAIDPAIEAKARTYYVLLMEDRKRQQQTVQDAPVAETPAAPAAKMPDTESDLRERFVINDVMRLTAIQRQIFQKKMQEIGEGEIGSFSQEIHLEEIASRLASKGLFHKDEFSEKEAKQYLKEMHANIQPKAPHKNQKKNTPPVDPDALTEETLFQIETLEAEDEYDLPDDFSPLPSADVQDLSSTLVLCADRKVKRSKEYRDYPLSEYLNLPKFSRLKDVYRLFCAAAVHRDKPFDPAPFTEGMTLLLDIVKQDHLEYGFASILYSIASTKCGVTPAHDIEYRNMLACMENVQPTPANHSVYTLLNLIADTSHD